MKNNSEYKPSEEILAKYLGQDCSESEKIELEAWISEKRENREIIEELQKFWEHAQTMKNFDAINVKADWQVLKSRLGEGFQEPVSKPMPKLVPIFVRIAAVVLLAIGLGIIIRYIFDSDPETLHLITQHNIEEILLSDGSKVFLNQHSELSYPEKFSKDERVVNLKGEAYFEVSPDKAKAFSVVTSRSLIRVLGTSFNVNEDPNQSLTTIHVTSGRVAFYNSDDTSKQVVLCKNEKAILANNNISTTTIDDTNYLSWKTGLLEFKGSPLSAVVSDLSEHYKRIIIISDPAVEEYKYTSLIDNQTLNDVLEEIKLVFSLEHMVKNDTIFIYPHQ